MSETALWWTFYRAIGVVWIFLAFVCCVRFLDGGDALWLFNAAGGVFVAGWCLSLRRSAKP